MNCSNMDTLDYDSDQDLPQFTSDPIPSNVTSASVITSSSITSIGQSVHHLIQEGNRLLRSGDPDGAINLFTESIAIDPTSWVPYLNRSAAHLQLGSSGCSLQDAIRARELSDGRNGRTYYRQGLALIQLGRHADALAAFASGLSQEPKSTKLLVSFVESALKSPFRGRIEPIYRQLVSMNLDKSPFIVAAVMGQELMSTNKNAAIVILESSLMIGTCSMKLRGSVYSSLSSAYWDVGQPDKAVNYMESDLQISKSLGDSDGECRGHSNLGGAYFTSGQFECSLNSHQNQLIQAKKSGLMQEAIYSLSSLGHVYYSMKDFEKSLKNHKQGLALAQQINDVFTEVQESVNVANCLLNLGEDDQAITYFEQAIALAASTPGGKNMMVEAAKGYNSLAAICFNNGDIEKAVSNYESLLKVAQEVGDKLMEGKAFSGLGHAAFKLNDLVAAKRWYSRQLESALISRDKKSEGQACSNLGLVYQGMSDFDGALKLHWAHLQVMKEMGDPSGMGKAYANIGSCYSALNRVDDSNKFHGYKSVTSFKKPKSICST